MSSGISCGFVVLHYQSLEMTVRCVDTLLEHLGSQPVSIVVVDNGSPNGSGVRLRERYRVEHKVEVVLTGENLGFARGNNVGYAWLKEHGDPDFIVVMNNDVLIEQDDFVGLVQRLHARQGFAVLGPDIYEPATGCHRNPYKTEGYSRDEVQRLLRNMHLWDKFFPYRYGKLRSASRTQKRRDNAPSSEVPWKREAVGCMLQGSCFVFSREFTSVRSVAFCPDTFLYFEEAILARDCEKLGLKMLYSPEVRVTHLGSVSTKHAGGSDYKREKLKNRQHFQSVQVFVNRYDSMDVCDR